ncbi:hypothetical protein ACIO52_31980 [Nocardia sp. NPDC087230]|uniref:hypothetical protein n=1 Tax=Nocardia sp. NPDC087230 TaxID=3364331 RepID=UPI00380D0950
MSKTTKADIDAAREYYETHSVEDEIDKSVPGEPVTSPMSGYSVRLPTEILEQARKIAGERGITTGAWLREAIENAVAAHTTEPSEKSGAVPVSEILALVAKHSAAPQQPDHEERTAAQYGRLWNIYMTTASCEDPTIDAPAPAAPKDLRRSVFLEVDGVLHTLTDLPAPIDDERGEQAVLAWLQDYHDRQLPRAAGMDVAWPDRRVPVKWWGRAPGSDVEVTRIGNTTKRRTAQQRLASSRRHPKV